MSLMEFNRKEYTVDDLVEYKRTEMLSVDSEYQRGPVWKPWQKKRFIDSVMRGYPIPVLYIHYIRRQIRNHPATKLYIIDGQQRILSLYEFHESAWKLFHPEKDDSIASFPNFVKDKECPWGGKSFEEFSDELKKKFLQTKLPVVEITSEDKNLVRDLFIRLQEGSPLKPQEVRDAWPGNFTEFILKLGGKPELPRYPGNDFFQKVMRMNPRTDRGKTRQLAAQIAMLFSRYISDKQFCNIQSEDINAFYHKQIDFDVKGEEANRLKNILGELTRIFSDGRRKKIVAHEAIHLVLLLSSLEKDYVTGWKNNLPDALDEFRNRFNQAKNAVKEDKEYEFNNYWHRYGRWTRTNSDVADSIGRRHKFFLGEMIHLLNLKTKDPKRAFGQAQRESIYFRDNKLCQVCVMGEQEKPDVQWEDMEIHHVTPHSQGGKTTIENAVLVHKGCHPKGNNQEEEFKKWWQSNLEKKGAKESVSQYPTDSTAGERIFIDPDSDSMRFSRITSVSINGEKLVKSKWRTIVNRLVELAIQKGVSIEEIAQEITWRDFIEEGRTNQDTGWTYNAEGNFSLCSLSADDSLKAIKQLARMCNIKVHIQLEYRKGPDKGKTAKIQI